MIAFLVPLISLLFLGFGVGFFQAVLGFGGGTLIVPILDLILDIEIKQVIATSFFVICLTAAINLISYHRMKLISWRIGLRIAFFAFIGGLISSQLNHFLSDRQTRWILLVLYFFLILFSLLPFEKIPQFFKDVNLRNKIMLGLTAGGFSGLTGIGGGTFIVPIFISGRWVKPSEVPGTSNIINFTSTFFSLIGLEFILWKDGAPQWHINHLVQWKTGFIIFLGALVSSQILRLWQKGLTEIAKKRMIAAILGVIFLKLTWDLI